MRTKFPQMRTKFPYGSRVYGTHRPDSDHDWIVVDPQQAEPILDIRTPGEDFTVYSLAEFRRKMELHEVSIVECMMLPDHLVTGDRDSIGQFQLDLSQLRSSFAKQASNSWVKARKKLEEGELRIAQKSLFHVFRIIQFGTQIAETGRIHDWQAANHILTEVESLPTEWAEWKDRFQARKNEAESRFRKSAPKK